MKYLKGVMKKRTSYEQLELQLRVTGLFLSHVEGDKLNNQRGELEATNEKLQSKVEIKQTYCSISGLTTRLA